MLNRPLPIAVLVAVAAEAPVSEGMPRADLVLITHEHPDHFDLETLEAMRGDAPVIAPQLVAEQLPEGMQEGLTVLANGESSEQLGLGIEAIPAYNITEDRLQFHPEGRPDGAPSN